MGEPGDEIELVRDEENRHPALGQFGQELEDCHLVRDIEESGRLVDHQRVSALSQGTRDPHPLPFPTRQRRRSGAGANRRPRRDARPRAPPRRRCVGYLATLWRTGIDLARRIRRTVSGNAGSSRCGTTATRWAMARALSARIAVPPIEMCPAVIGTRLSSARTSVLFPLPLGPRDGRDRARRRREADRVDCVGRRSRIADAHRVKRDGARRPAGRDHVRTAMRRS